ncbi:A24 family peptidase [Leclercia adecarboxylata]|uniref:prepilin peptidase n=1 Tax=Leclercia adecarboxylata TaxID=83655 RepID=UPI002DB6AC64|nr:A24 family peptidase [Leclercia adecarboxylata]MEB6379131.1 A24 family peptidase [Leclercia adecarboxylata]
MSTQALLHGQALPGFCAASAGLGAIFGSFLGVVAERLPAWIRQEAGAGNLLYPPSHCPACQHRLSAWENIPLIGWLLLRGRCRQCKTPIPARLLLMELLSALFFAISAWLSPSLPVMLALWLLWCGLLPLAVIDLRERLLPDALTQPLLWAGLLLNLHLHLVPLADALYGAVAGYLTLWLVYWGHRLATGREGLGYGDFKLLAALGAWCGWQALPSLLLIAAGGGIVGWAICFKRRNDHFIPFGPFLAFAGLLIFILQHVFPIF